eukprot:scaffold26663_cov134-Isochrysis_galbana.AAC.3
MSSAFPFPPLPRPSIIYSCPVCFNPQLPNPQIYPARSIAVASAQFQVRDPTVEREGPVTPLYGPFDCWQNTQSTPPDQPIVMPVHPSHIPLAPMYPPDFDSPTSVIDTPTPAGHRLSGRVRGPMDRRAPPTPPVMAWPFLGIWARKKGIALSKGTKHTHFFCSQSRDCTPPRPIEGPEELNFHTYNPHLIRSRDAHSVRNDQWHRTARTSTQRPTA